MALLINPVSQVNNLRTGISSAAVVLNANVNRAGFILQNQGTNPLFIAFGSGATLVQPLLYHVVLRAGTATYDGSGATLTQMAGVVYQGQITAAGTGPLYTIAEF